MKIVIRRTDGNIVIAEGLVTGRATVNNEAEIVAAAVFDNKPILARYNGVVPMVHSQRDGNYLDIKVAIRNLIFDEVKSDG